MGTFLVFVAGAVHVAYGPRGVESLMSALESDLDPGDWANLAEPGNVGIWSADEVVVCLRPDADTSKLEEALGLPPRWESSIESPCCGIRAMVASLAESHELVCPRCGRFGTVNRDGASPGGYEIEWEGRG